MPRERLCKQSTQKQIIYVVMDDKSNCLLAKPTLFDLLNLDGKVTLNVLKTCRKVKSREDAPKPSY